jgi:SAM-dependent methyltransferase
MDAYEAIAAYYDLEHAGFREDIEFYLNVLPSGTILEVGAGTGRVTHPLVEAGWEVWALDSSRAMLQRADDRIGSDGRAHLVEGSVLDLHLDERFDAAIFPLNTLWHFTQRDEQVDALRVVHQHLLDGGLLCLDLSNPLTLADRGSRGEIRSRFTHESPDRTVHAMSAAWDSEADQLLHLEIAYDETRVDRHVMRTRAILDLRYIFRSELELMVKLAGFTVRNVYGSYDLDPYGAESPNLVLTATRD